MATPANLGSLFINRLEGQSVIVGTIDSDGLQEAFPCNPDKPGGIESDDAARSAETGREGRPMTCREFTDFLHKYLFGSLPVEERAEFDRHLAECPWCVAYLDSYQKTIQLEHAAFSTAADAPPPADAPEELIQAILRARSRPW